MIDIHAAQFRISSSTKLYDVPTRLNLNVSENKIVSRLNKLRTKLSAMQELLYAHRRYSVLICIQGMDTAGKDSLIREVFKDFNPRGIVVNSFKSPTAIELAHDFLWRHYLVLPERGVFGIFNRSHYENVLIARVHPEIVLKERIPGINNPADITPDFWKKRFKQIKNFEKHLTQNGTLVLKFFLHISKDEQRNRILRRLENPQHHWKFEPADINEREYWEQYQHYYAEALQVTSTKKCPWFVIPADHKETARLLVAHIILEQLLQLQNVTPQKMAPSVEEKIDFYHQSLLDE